MRNDSGVCRWRVCRAVRWTDSSNNVWHSTVGNGAYLAGVNRIAVNKKAPRYRNAHHEFNLTNLLYHKGEQGT